MNRVVPVVVVFLMAGCSGGSTLPDETSSPPSEVSRQADIYEAIVTEAGQDQGHMWIVDQICADAGATKEPGGCVPMSAELKAALQERFPNARFTDDPFKMEIDLDNAARRIIYKFGPVSGSGDRAEVPASYWCGGLCAYATTHVVEMVDGTWKVTGSVGPIMQS